MPNIAWVDGWTQEWKKSEIAQRRNFVTDQLNDVENTYDHHLLMVVAALWTQSAGYLYNTDKRVAEMGQHWHEHGRNARKSKQRQGQGKVCLSVATQRQRRWLVLRLLLVTPEH
ncbi:hypothetical protein RR48_08475 [Papilio machaon]|uniref:Uncharacterized protein n=1 Tax=Papilio machaon TaxID=76193 RepID=A0A194QPN3_PAPMA|nr:hypothetical protein RR48_08475 [Papilio machaon]